MDEMGGNGLGQRVLLCVGLPLVRVVIKLVDVLLVPAPPPPSSSFNSSSHVSVDVGEGAG